ncbi:MAG: tRNA pseudouridine(38-40) synthase TruA [Verrucomicrobiae bacterium]|nr:tRNA pseudouridine(38-40) synthase TruA [Verrucomicrobiae bacterium]MDW8343110.1 tRNA pseudouridine(38-40) synthase TruA [Verrucomicrobiae bacterium]
MPRTTRRKPVSESAGTWWKLVVAYDGTAYGGWQRQPNAITIQEVLERVLARVTGQQVTVHGSGRTDAGVHARGQVASCECATRLRPMELQRALNANLPADVRVLRVTRARPGFHARFDAVAKEYRYQLDLGPVADPFLRRYAWHHPQRLNLRAMRRAARWLRGRHDFTALSATGDGEEKNCVRRIMRLTIRQEGQLVTIGVRADGFLYKMVRTLVGALVKVGEGKLTPEELRELVRQRRRVPLLETAPAHGLFLWRVWYR